MLSYLFSICYVCFVMGMFQLVDLPRTLFNTVVTLTKTLVSLFNACVGLLNTVVGLLMRVQLKDREKRR